MMIGITTYQGWRNLSTANPSNTPVAEGLNSLDSQN